MGKALDGKEKRPPRVGRLDTIGSVATEMGKVYRQARKGDLATGDAMRLVQMLSHIRGALEIGEIERRIEDLERSYREAHEYGPA